MDATSTAAAGIANERQREKALVARLRPRGAPGKFGAVQADALWSEQERRHLRPGHHWVFEFGNAGANKGIFEKKFTLPAKKWEVYKGTRFYDGEAALVIERWFHRADDDASGCTFVEWDPTKDADPSKPATPVEMIINSSELRGVGFKLTEVLPPELEGAARRRTRTRTRGAGVARLEGVAPSQYVLKSSDDNDLRALCE